MTLARRLQISLDHTPYYHCTSRCVRRAFLCGDDAYSGQNFDHRRQWLEQRLITLSSVFAIDLLAYAVMSNHYHVVIRIDNVTPAEWTNDDVIERWGAVFSVPGRVTDEDIRVWRERLCSLSWYMRAINEPLARRSNREDQCSGRFWEGRFKCQALLDNESLLKCMAYVDLNPIRADTSKTPETSKYTSIRARIRGKADHLVKFRDQAEPESSASTIPLRKNEYLQLVDWTGRQLRRGKRGRINADVPPILQRLSIASDDWLAEITHYGRWYYRAVGSLASLQKYCEHLGQQWLKGTSVAARVTMLS